MIFNPAVTNPVHALKPHQKSYSRRGRRTFAFACSLQGGGNLEKLAQRALEMHIKNYTHFPNHIR